MNILVSLVCANQERIQNEKKMDPTGDKM